nr:hypothetical protein [Tanacetum cinerariifolium]
MVIKKLKERIKSLSGNMKEEKKKQELREIETINIELDHRVTKFIAENEHLKQTYNSWDDLKFTISTLLTTGFSARDDVDINTLTIEQYLALIHDNNRPSIMKPNIGDDVEFDINNNCMRELRRKLFAGTDDEDAHKHVRRVLEIVDLFHFLDHSHDWYDEAITRERINNIPDSVDAIHASFKKAHLPEVFPLKKRTRQTTKGNGDMKESVPRDLLPTPFLGHLKEQMGSPYRTRETVCMIENLREVHKMKAQEDEGDMDVVWDITIKDVERLRQFLTPTTYTLPNLEPEMQPYMPLGPVYDREKIVKEEEQDYDIPLHNGVIIAGGLDLVNPVIRLPIEHGINRGNITDMAWAPVPIHIGDEYGFILATAGDDGIKEEYICVTRLGMAQP